MSKTDTSLALSASSALAILIGPTATLVTAAFVAGLLPGQHPRQPQ